MAGPFKGFHQQAVVVGAGAGNAAGDDFTLFGQKSHQGFVVFVIDVFYIVFAKPADSLFYSNHLKPQIEIDTLPACGETA